MANAEEKTEYDFDGMAEIVGDINPYVPPTEEELTPDPVPAPSGYMSKEAWTESGKDPDLWVSEDVFKERTQRIKETYRLKRELAEKDREFESRLKNVNTLQQAQLARQRAELMERKDDAIDIADKGEVKRLEKEIEALDKEAELVADKPQSKAPLPPEIAEWEEENPWVNDVTDPRTPIAQAAYSEAIAAGKTVAFALRAADKAVSNVKPESKQAEIKKKPAVSMSDSSRSVASNDSLTLSWGQLTSEEKALHEELFSHKSQKDFLKIVADARTGVKK